MLRYFRQIETRAGELGNQRRKHLHAIERHGRRLVDRLEAAGRFDRVHLHEQARDVGAEMDAVAASGRDREEVLTLLGCYHAVQFLLLNVRSIDLLRLRVAREDDPIVAYRRFVRRASEDFGALIGEYLRRLLDLFLADGPRPEFAVCTVGTRLHQDDVDIGIIDDGSEARSRLNRAVGRMAREMTRWSTLPDFYLSEHIGGRGYSVSIDEYRERLDEKILDFVVVTEILSAYPIAGSEKLFRRFQRQIHGRYFAGRHAYREHEGYLRGLLGEIESLLLWPHAPQHIQPKDDLLRLTTAVMWAYRTISRIRETDPWIAFARLSRGSARRRELFHDLERSYTFVETFRHLYQQFGSQEETIDVTDPQQQETLDRVASAMGFDGGSVVGARERLLVHYSEHVKEGQKRVQALLPWVEEHVRKTTVFADWLRPAAGPREPFASFLREVPWFRRVKYWDDLLDELEARDGALAEEVVRELAALGDARRDEVLGYFVEWAYHTFSTLLRFLAIVGSARPRSSARQVFHSLHRAFLGKVRGSPDEIRRLSTVFVYYPEIVYRYVSLLDDASRARLLDALSGAVWDDQVARWRDRLVCFCEVYSLSSRYFRRAIQRACEHHPRHLLHFGEPEALERSVRGGLADLLRLPDHEERRDELGICYDVEFLRIGLGTLQGEPLPRLDAVFTEFADQYLELLFDLCKTEEDARRGRRILTHDLLGLFVAGGHARGRAHQDDYDLVILLDSDDDEIHGYSQRIIARLSREIARRGIMPQYRLADRFGGCVTRLSELAELLTSGADDTLIEMCQMLGARLVAGSRRLEAEFRRRILRDGIYARKEMFLRAVRREIRSRREYEKEVGSPMELHVKECRGGLRDLELAMMMWKAAYEIDEPIGTSFWNVLATTVPAAAEDFRVLREDYLFFNRLRDVYRLTVGPSNLLDEELLDGPAHVLGFRDEAGRPDPGALALEFRRRSRESAERLDRRLDDLAREVPGT